jgi:hypothetical protein
MSQTGIDSFGHPSYTLDVLNNPNFLGPMAIGNLACLKPEELVRVEWLSPQNVLRPWRELRQFVAALRLRSDSWFLPLKHETSW